MSASGASDLALIVGGDCNSRVVNPNDIKTYPLFGDGAGAILMTRGRPDQGILSYSLGADGSAAICSVGPRAAADCRPRRSSSPTACTSCTWMAAPSFAGPSRSCVTRFKTSSSTRGMLPTMSSLYIPHQANIRIINAAIDVLHISRSRVFNNLDRYGNTSAGSVPLALDEALGENRLRRDDLVLLSGFGAGLAWGTALVRW